MITKKKYKINKGFVVQKEDRKLKIFDTEESRIYVLNETASFIFQKIRKGSDLIEIINFMVKKYNISAEEAEADLKILMIELRNKKIIFEATK